MPINPRFAPHSARRVEILAFPSVQLLDVAGPLQVFASANDLARAGRPYEPRIIACAGGLVGSSAGLGLAAQPLPPAGEPVDTLIVAGGGGVHVAARDDALVGWLTEHARVARRVASVCTGAFLLARTGLLDGRRAVTHWSRCAELARCYPAIRVEPDPIFIQDGAVWTSAGVTSGIDLALALVEADLGRAAALAVARQLVVFLKRPGGQAQFSATLKMQHGSDGAGFERLHAWIAEHLGGDLSVAALAEQAGMSERSFVRHYRHGTGETPARAVEQIRVEVARQMLGETSEPIKRVASRCGFGSEETMRRSFLRLLGTTPQAYRERFAELPAATAPRAA
jgi:transcriptional regulator GlxA family with amidase domain